MDLIVNTSMFLSYLLEGYIAYSYFSDMFERRKGWTATVLLYSVGFSVLFLLYFLDNSALNLVGLLVVASGLGLLVFRTSVLKSIFHAGVIAVLLVASETLVIALCNMMFNVNASVNRTPAVVIIVGIAAKFLLLLMCRSIAFISVKDNVRNWRSLLLFTVPCASLLCMLIIFYQSARLELAVGENLLNCITAILLLGANLLVFYVYEKTIGNEQELTRIRLLEQREQMDYDYYRMLEEMQSESRVIIHDMKHHLNLIRSMAEEDHETETVKYVSAILDQPYFRKTAMLSGNKIMDAILMRKASECSAKGIQLTLNHNHVNLSFVSDFDLCCIVSNIMDNALEAAENSKEKLIEINMCRSSNDSFYSLEIINSCDSEPKRNDSGYKSAKLGKYHGIGLYSIKQTIKKYRGELYVEYLENEHRFRTSVMLQR